MVVIPYTYCNWCIRNGQCDLEKDWRYIYEKARDGTLEDVSGVCSCNRFVKDENLPTA